MKVVPVFLVLGLVSIASGTPTNFDDHALVLRQKREIDIFGNTRKLIEELVQNLQQSAQQAVQAIGTFTQGLQNQAALFTEKLANDIKSLRERVTEAITKITDKFTGAGTAVRQCIESKRQEADSLLSETAAKSKSCADERIQDVRELLQNLDKLSKDAFEFSNSAIEDLKKCTELNSGNIIATGTCLGSVAVQTEMRGAIFLSQSGLLITRINLAVAILPAALDVCAGAQLVSAGIGTAKLIMEIGSCSASSVISTFAGNSIES